jgi:transaldolase
LPARCCARERSPVSFEVFSDDFAGRLEQALKLAELAANVYVKIPITNTKRESACPLIKDLSQQDVKLNLTALMTRCQVRDVAAALNPRSRRSCPFFAGRIADSVTAATRCRSCRNRWRF